VAKTLRINISTAKLILKKYKETGSFFKKKMCKNKYKNQRTAVRPKLKQAPPSLQK
jgi:transposase